MNPNVILQVRRSFILGALAGLAMAVPAQAQKELTKAFVMPVQVQAAVNMLGCENSPGPQITLDGAVKLGGLTVQLTFRNNVKGTHTYTDESSVDVVAVPAGGSLEIPKQPVLGGVGGNPFIWVQLVDGSGSALGDEIFLGRCVQGPFKIDADVPAQVVAAADFAALDCSNNQGPYITVYGGMGFSKGILARFIFRNNDNPVGGPHEADRWADVSIIPPGLTLQFPKQPVLGGVGGNPLIYALFEQGDGTAIGNEVLLGRCVQLAPGN
jgi:hypothetical protein